MKEDTRDWGAAPPCVDGLKIESRCRIALSRSFADDALHTSRAEWREHEGKPGKKVQEAGRREERHEW